MKSHKNKQLPKPIPLPTTSNDLDPTNLSDTNSSNDNELIDENQQADNTKNEQEITDDYITLFKVR